ncbi:MAG: C40 family peptidase [Mycobacterium sp.]
MSLDALVREVAQALGDARRLFGPAPVPGGLGTAGGLGSGRDAVSQANGAAAQNWSGAGGSSYVASSGERVAALDSVIGADEGTTAGLGGSADASTRGRGGTDAVINDTRAGVAAIAPSTDTPAGRQQLVNHLQSQMQRAKMLLQVSQQRNMALAAMIRNAAAGYRGGLGGPAMPGLPAMGAPAMMPGAGAGALALPALARLTALTHQRRGAGPMRHAPPTAIGGGPAAQVAVKAALSKLGRPYVWGAKGPDAFDCSGLVRWSYAQAGVTLGADTYSQFQQGTQLAPADVQAGDLVFPKSSLGEGGHPGPGHVMMAISPTECVEAQQNGVPVKISPMPSAFFVRRPTTA